jgi:hypothetical protein
VKIKIKMDPSVTSHSAVKGRWDDVRSLERHSGEVRNGAAQDSSD